MVLLLVALLVCHYLADYCFTTPSMIRAKAEGRRLWPIMFHASIHAGVVGLCILPWGISWRMLSLLVSLELVSHFLIDTAKGRLTAHYPVLADMQGKPYWMLYGFDQFLHLLVIVLIWFCII